MYTAGWRIPNYLYYTISHIVCHIKPSCLFLASGYTFNLIKYVFGEDAALHYLGFKQG